MKRHQVTNTKSKCPGCGAFRSTSLRFVGCEEEAAVFSSKPGDLTECDKCKQLLEVTEDGTLRRARRQRVREFNALATGMPFHRELPAVVNYVMRFRRMPRKSPLLVVVPERSGRGFVN